MVRYVSRRLILSIPVLLLVSIAVFSLVHLAPGDPLFAILGQDQGDPEVIATLRHRMGLDKPLPVQYGRWLAHVVRGDLGYSYALHQSVGRALIDRLPVTLELTVITVLFSTTLAAALGILAAVYRGSWIDLATGAFAAIGASMPGFWFGILLILAFAVKLHLLPPLGYVPPSDPLGNLRSLILPSITLALGYSAVLSRLMRASLLDVLGQDHVRTARSKGLKERAVVLRHGARNALVPVVTVVGMHIGRLLGGTVVVETIFALPGVGQLAVTAVLSRDFPTIQGVTLFMAVAMIVANLVSDLLYGVIDPRIRYT